MYIHVLHVMYKKLDGGLQRAGGHASQKKLMLHVRRTRKLPGWTRSACEQVRALASAGPLDQNRASSLADVHQKQANAQFRYTKLGVGARRARKDACHGDG